MLTVKSFTGAQLCPPTPAKINPDNATSRRFGASACRNCEARVAYTNARPAPPAPTPTYSRATFHEIRLCGRAGPDANTAAEITATRGAECTRGTLFAIATMR